MMITQVREIYEIGTNLIRDQNFTVLYGSIPNIFLQALGTILI